MKLKKLWLTLLALSLTQYTLAQSKSDVEAEDGQLIEIGAGVSSQRGNTVDALIKVSTNVTSDTSYGAYYVLVRMNADGTISAGNLNYVDFELHALGAGISTDNVALNGFLEATLLNINYQKNLSINLQDQLLVSLVGIRGGATLEVHEDLKVLAESAVDFVALGVSSKRASDAASLAPNRSGLAYRVQIAVELMKKFRIAAGVEGSITQGKGTTSKTGAVVCDTYYDYYSYGYYYSTYTYCYDVTQTNYAQTFTSRSAYLSVAAQITDRLKAFGKVAYNVYSIKDYSQEVQSSHDASWMFMFGLSYTIGNNNQR